MITLEEYKSYLINVYKYEIDNSLEQKNKRQECLSQKYNDKYLNKIIDDTLKIINNIIDYGKLNYYSIKLKEPNLTKSIYLNLCGGWSSDIVYEDESGNLISEYLLRKIFGERLIVEIKEKEYEFDTEDPDILSFDYEYFLYLQNIKNIRTLKLIKSKNE